MFRLQGETFYKIPTITKFILGEKNLKNFLCSANKLSNPKSKGLMFFIRVLLGTINKS